MGNAIFIVGRSGSGKTTVCKKLEEFGFKRISASNCLKSLYMSELGSKPSRIELADYGKMLLREHRLQKFHSALKVAMGDQGVVCVDGLRFKLSVEELSRMADRALLIFLSCPPATRRSRSSDQISESEFDILGLHETEISVDAMKDSSDAIIDTSKPIADVLLDLESELRKQQFI